MKSVRQFIEEAVKLDLAPMFKRHGFKKTALNFARRQGSVGHLINLQLSQWNQGVNGCFYVNVGVLFDDICRLRGLEPPALPKHGDCDFMVSWEQLDSQLPGTIEVNEKTDLKSFSEWLAAKVESTVVSPLDAVSSTQEFDRTGWIVAGRWGFPATYHFIVGNKEEARRLVQVEATRFADRGYTFESLASRFGLTFNE